ncbi:MAG: DinB family protein [Actinomycetia bacterium]|nr:DinB family protein [Actinomycetes bacterium]
MTWTAPPIDRRDLPSEGDERTLLNAFLDFHRETLLWKCSGLTGAQLALRPVPTSTMSLLGLVRHMTDVERYWLRNVVGNEDMTTLYWDQPDHDSDFDDICVAGAEHDFTAYLEETEQCRAVQPARDLDSIVTDRANGGRNSFRWVMVHMIEEYARHNGHADLFREAIDGAVGE